MTCCKCIDDEETKICLSFFFLIFVYAFVFIEVVNRSDTFLPSFCLWSYVSYWQKVFCFLRHDSVFLMLWCPCICLYVWFKLKTELVKWLFSVFFLLLNLPYFFVFSLQNSSRYCERQILYASLFFVLFIIISHFV